MDISLDRLPPRLKNKISVSTDGCWLWTGSISPEGYSRVNIDGKIIYAHRYIYEYFVDKIPEGLQLDHLCRVRNCVNPKDLEPVTSRENGIRGIGPASRANSTSCQKRT